MKVPRITDAELVAAAAYAKDMDNRFEVGIVPRSAVLMAQRVLTRAQYLHGDVSKAQFQEKSSAIQVELMQIVKDHDLIGQSLDTSIIQQFWNSFLDDKSTM
jgi:hypothetical protein